MAAIDLQPFCDEFREWLNAPFSIGDFSYATNGHVLVRVPRRADIAELTARADVPRVLDGIEGVAMSPLVGLMLPPPPSTIGMCVDCAGGGFLDDESRCANCLGFGDLNIEARTSTTLRGVIFNLSYVRLLAGLPGIAIAQKPPREDRLFFKFDDGIGALMPMRNGFALHVEVERP